MSRELSKKNKYYIPLYRRKELEYYCRQYDDYKEWLRTSQNFIPSKPSSVIDLTVRSPKGGYPDLSDLVCAGIEKRQRIDERVNRIENGLWRISFLCSIDISEQIIHGAPSDGSAKMRKAIQRFYWYLDQQESYL